MAFVGRPALVELVAELEGAVREPSTLQLVGETSLLWHGERRWCDELELVPEVAETDRPAVERVLREASERIGAPVVVESPVELIPLPTGWQGRAVPIEPGDGSPLALSHFDPYSVACCSIARGDERDYLLVLDYLRLGWVELAELDRLLDELLPRFSFDTIQQDPAEFRRKYAGLRQMWRSAAAP